MMIYDVWLQRALGFGKKKLKQALEFYGNSENIFKADENSLVLSNVFSKMDIKRITETTLNDAKQIIKDCKKRKINIITISDPKYPQCLREIDSPPIVLYYRGTFPDFDNTPTVAVVGTREITEYGGKCAYSLGLRLAKAGMIVVSGGARGGDRNAHLGALCVGGLTVAVLGCGLDYPYLYENKKMRTEIEKTGCVISEYPPMYPAGKKTFPVRNRILAGLSLGVVVVEAPEKSGSLITANRALEEGRDVFVVPGRAGDATCAGSNMLLRDGAIPLLSAMDIFNEYLQRFPDKINIEEAFKPTKKVTSSKNTQNLKSNLSKSAKMLYNNLNTEIFTMDDIFVEGLSAGEIIAAFTELELSGYIKAVPGGRYTKNK